MEYWSKVWTLLFFRVLSELLDCWRRRGILYPQSIFIVLALYKLFVKFELKLLKKSVVLPLSLRSVAVFVLIGLNTTEANPIKISQGEEKKQSFRVAYQWVFWGNSALMTVKPRAILSLKKEDFRLVDWILGLPLRVGGGGQTWWQQTRKWLIGGFTWNSIYSATRYPATTPLMISKRTGWHKVCIAIFGNKVIPFSNCIGALLSEGVMQRCLS